MVVLYNPRKEDRKVTRAWVWFWRLALALCIVLAFVLVNRQ
jgi:hypothetical protein